METVGVKELKTHLSRYLELAKSGERIVVTERGSPVAELVPLSQDLRAVQSLLKSGRARWAGGKPRGLSGVTLPGRAMSDIIIEGRD